jgi:hypothetical protein
MLARQGHPKAAIAAYRAFLDNNPYAAERQQAMEALAQLGAPANLPTPMAGNPASIEPPAP